MKPKRLFTFLVVACLLFPFIQQGIYGQGFTEMKAKVQVKTLKNGMKFIVLPRPQAPVVSFHVYADVGSAQESYGITGISHLLEHMAFKGTTTVGTKDVKAEVQVLNKMDLLYNQMVREENSLKPNKEKLAKMKEEFESLRKKAKNYVINNEFFDMMMREGDAGVNAYTSNDATQYIDSLPANKLEFWMAMTSDRFLNPVFREFYKERDVVMEERRLGLETRPTGKLIEDFFATSFKAHPYHHSVIGHMSDLEGITRQDTMDYFKKFYSPSNLTVGIVGDVKPEEVFKLAKLYFERIPSGPEPPALRTQEPEQWGERRVQVVAKSQPILLIGYHRPASTHKDNNALEALANIVGQGRSSRMWELLVKKEKIAAACGSFNGWPGDKYPNLIAFYAVPNKDKTNEECLKLIEEELENIKNKSVTDQELAKYKMGKKIGLINQMKSNSSMASMLTYADVVLGDWQQVFETLKGVDAITADDIKRVANTYLTKSKRTIGELIPEDKK